MEYARYENQVAPASWNPDQSTPIIPPQAHPQLQTPQQNIKADPQPQTQHPQPQPIVYGATSHHPMPCYDMSVNWTPQMVSQSAIQVPQWPEQTSSIGHAVPLDPVAPLPATDPCIHPSAHSQQSHYAQYPTISGAPTYWNPDIIDCQPATLISSPTTTAALPTTMPEVPGDPALIDNTFTLNHPNVSSAIQTPGVPATVTSQPNQFEDPVTLATSSSVVQLPPGVIEGPGSLEDALEVIKSHAENFSGHGQTCSSTSGDDDDDDLSRGPRNGEREKERRQANNARER